MFSEYFSTGQKVLEKQNQLGQVWISGYQFALNIAALKEKNIFAICSGVDLRYNYPSQFDHILFDLDDSHSQQVSFTFKPVFEFIQRSRKKTNVLVNCAAGISRSSTLLIAYMMQKYRWSYEKCLQKVKQARKQCQPNMSFVRQLTAFESQLGIKEFPNKNNQKI